GRVTETNRRAGIDGWLTVRLDGRASRDHADGWRCWGGTISVGMAPSSASGGRGDHRRTAIPRTSNGAVWPSLQRRRGRPSTRPTEGLVCHDSPMPRLTLTDEEQALFDGAGGAGSRLAMRVVVAMARAQGATSLLPVTAAHVD